MSDPTLHTVTITLCSLCIDGDGGECRVAGCALRITRGPDLSLRDNPMVAKIDDWEVCGECGLARACTRSTRKGWQLCGDCYGTGLGPA